MIAIRDFRTPPHVMTEPSSRGPVRDFGTATTKYSPSGSNRKFRIHTQTHVTTEPTCREPIKDFMNVYNEMCAHGNHLLTQTLLHYRNKETLKAESQPARTQRDEQLKYAQRVNPQQRTQGKRRHSRRQPQQGTEQQENNGRQGHNHQSPGARGQTVRFQPGRNTKPVTATTLLSLYSSCTR